MATKKIILLATTLLGLATFARAQSFDPQLAGKLQQKIDSMRTAGNLRGISACARS